MPCFLYIINKRIMKFLFKQVLVLLFFWFLLLLFNVIAVVFFLLYFLIHSSQLIIHACFVHFEKEEVASIFEKILSFGKQTMPLFGKSVSIFCINTKFECQIDWRICKFLHLKFVVTDIECY